MTKRPILLLMVLLMLIGMAGCGKQQDTPAPSKPSDTQQTEQTDLTDHYLPAEPDERLALAVKQNKDAVAWLTVEGMTIDDAVLQSVDNDYYLRRDALGNYSLEGCYFADYECRFGSSKNISKNLVIYGHTFQDDEQKRFFAQLHRYTEDREWALAHRYIKLSVSDVMLTYEIISAGETDADNDGLAITPARNLNEFSEAAKRAIERSTYDFGTTAAECSSLLTLPHAPVTIPPGCWSLQGWCPNEY